MADFNLNTNNQEEWLTQPELVYSLGCFDLDPCAPVNPPWKLAPKYYTEACDGLNQVWNGRVWLNPPYGKETFKWIERLSEHQDGIALIFARTETKGFHEHIWNKAHSVFMFEGRLNFYEKFYQVKIDLPVPHFDMMNLSQLKKYEINQHQLTGNTDWLNPAPANAPSCLVSYNGYDTDAIERAANTGMIKGRLILL